MTTNPQDIVLNRIRSRIYHYLLLTPIEHGHTIECTLRALIRYDSIHRTTELARLDQYLGKLSDLEYSQEEGLQARIDEYGAIATPPIKSVQVEEEIQIEYADPGEYRAIDEGAKEGALRQQQAKYRNLIILMLKPYGVYPGGQATLHRS